MNPKIKIFKFVNYVNLFAVLIFLGVLFYEILPRRAAYLTNDDFLGFFILFLILVVFLGNFYYGLKLTARFNKETRQVKFSNTSRLIFFILEIIVAILYAVFMYYSMKQLNPRVLWPIRSYNISRIIVLICLYAGFISSLLRLFFTRPVLRSIALQDKHMIDQLGNEAL